MTNHHADPATDTESSCTCPSGNGSLRWPCPTHPNAIYARRGLHVSPSIEQSASASAADTNVLFNGFDITKLPPILISCIAKLWPGSNGLFWEAALEKMPERIEHLMARAPAANAGDLTAAVDAAMVEMARITPPLRRSECERLIRAALTVRPAAAVAGGLTDREIMEEWDRHYLPGKAKGVPFLQTVVEFARHFMARPTATSAAALDVLVERRRQTLAEGWSLEHDDGYQEGELALAAVAYTLNTVTQDGPHYWPWPRVWWKPTNARSDLVKAAALVLAEIERIDRAAAKDAADQEGARDA